MDTEQKIAAFIKSKDVVKVDQCQRCGVSTELYEMPSFTCYHWDGEGEDPNKEVYLCSDCAHWHCEYWDGMWSEAGSKLF